LILKAFLRRGHSSGSDCFYSISRPEESENCEFAAILSHRTSLAAAGAIAAAVHRNARISDASKVKVF
jgi:hypothetical protein